MKRISENIIRNVTRNVINDFLMAESSNNDIENGLNPYSENFDDDYYKYKDGNVVNEMMSYQPLSDRFNNTVGGIIASKFPYVKKRIDQANASRDELFWYAEGILANTQRLDKNMQYTKEEDNFDPSPEEVSYACDIVKKYANEEEKEKLRGLYKDSKGGLHRIR